MRTGLKRALFGVTPCPQASAFLLRATGLTSRERTAYVRLINGLVKDGVWSKLGALYIFTTNTTTTAKLNLISTSFGLSEIGGALTFTADRGYTGVSGRALDTGLVLTAATQYGLNSGCMGGYVLTNRTSNSATALGGVNSTVLTYLRTHNASGSAEFDVNSATFSSSASTTSQGSWFVNRSAASGAGALTLYLNGSSFLATSVATGSVPPTHSVYINGYNNAGVLNSSGTDEIAAFWIGGGFNATDVANFSSRLNAYMTALGINVY
jgi:hypothetical protein